MHKCPLCGESTEGTISEGGVHFDICEECYQKEYSPHGEKKKGGGEKE